MIIALEIFSLRYPERNFVSAIFGEKAIASMMAQNNIRGIHDRPDHSVTASVDVKK